ncbi:MAG: hypothetical protein Q7V57_13550 [Actinomycetota bacterium]|nr:hypothetical protein [Actinomycetota bacterium]
MTNHDDDFDAMARAAGSALRRPAPEDGLTRVRTLRKRRQVVGTTMVGVAGLAILIAGVSLASRGSEPARPVGPVDTTPVPPNLDGAWTMDTSPEGLPFWGAEADKEFGMPSGDDWVVRIYATESATPEADPNVRLASFAASQTSVLIAPAADTVPVDVGGAAGSTWIDGEHQYVLFDRGGYTFWLDSVGIDDPLALAATVTRAPDNFGAVVDTNALPAGVIERAAGINWEVEFLSRAVLADGRVTVAHWESPAHDEGVFYVSFVESPSEFLLHRIDADYTKVVDIDLGVRQATLTAIDHFGSEPADTTFVWWNDGVRTVMVAGYGVTEQRVIDAATALRPATAAEWTAMVQQQGHTDVVTTTTVEVAPTGQPLELPAAPEGYAPAGQGIRPAGGEAVRGAVFVQRDANNVQVEEVIVRFGPINLVSGETPRTPIPVPANLAPAVQSDIVITQQDRTVRVQYDLGDHGNLMLESFHEDESTSGALADDMQAIAAALLLTPGEPINDEGVLPEGWSLVASGDIPEEIVPGYYQAFEVDRPDGGNKVSVENRFIHDPAFPFWIGYRSMLPVQTVTVRGHAGTVIFVNEYNWDGVSSVPVNESSMLIWEEAPDHWVTLWAGGMTTEQAVALADRLVPVAISDWGAQG